MLLSGFSFGEVWCGSRCALHDNPQKFRSPSPLCSEVLRVRLPRRGTRGSELGQHEKLAVLCRKILQRKNGHLTHQCDHLLVQRVQLSRSACGFTCVRKTTMIIDRPLQLRMKVGMPGSHDPLTRRGRAGAARGCLSLGQSLIPAAYDRPMPGEGPPRRWRLASRTMAGPSMHCRRVLCHRPAGPSLNSVDVARVRCHTCSRMSSS